MSAGVLPYSPASERNREPILQALRPRMPDRGTVLEIGAGTGQHAVFFAAALPGLTWLPTERPGEMAGLQARLDAEGPPNLLAARSLDVFQDSWPVGPFAAAYTANTAHIMPWEGVCAMLAGVSAVLAAGAPCFIYGPFKVDDAFTTPSNRLFDQDLRCRAPHMGLRDVAALESQARRHQMRLEERLDMPANNFLLVLRKSGNLDP